MEHSSDQPTFSVIVPTFDRPDLLAEAVASVVAQTESDWECIVVDDAGSVALPTFDDDRVVVERREVNGGVAAARNTGVERARGRYLTFLDDDDLWTPRRLEIARRGLRLHPVTACGSRYLDEEGPGSVRALEGDVSDTILDSMAPSHGQLAVERSVWQPFDEAYRTCEDIEWWLRVAPTTTVGVIDELGLLVRRHGGVRHLSDGAQRARDNDRLLAENAAWFDAHPRARAFRLRRRGHYASVLGRRGDAVRALVASLRIHPSARTAKQLLLAAAGRPPAQAKPGSQATPGSRGTADGLRVLVVMPAMSPEAGSERSMAAVMPLLLEAGVELHLAVLTKHQGLVPDLAAAGVTVHDLSDEGQLAQARALRAIVRRTRPDLVHATLFQAVLPTQLGLLGTRQARLVTWATTPTDRSSSPIATWKLTVVWAAEVLFSHVGGVRFHAVTQGVADTKCRELRVAPRLVRVAERGRDAGRFRLPTEEGRAKARADLGLGPDDRMVLAVGRQEPQKGYLDLIPAFDDVAGRDPSVQMFIAGRSGSQSARIEEAVDAMRNPGRVHLLGQRDDVVPLLHAADVVTCASVREGAAGALLEAMACGAPIATVDLDGMRGVLEDGVNSIVVPRSELATGIERMLADPARAAELAAAARRLFVDRFTVESSARALHEVYAWAAAAPGRRI